MLDAFNTELHSYITLTEHSALNFLAGLPSTSVGSDSTGIIVEKNELSDFKMAAREVLPQFMAINKYYQNSMFIIDDIDCQSDFKASVDYQKLKRDRKILWTTPQPDTAPEDRCLTLNVPLVLSDGQFMGVFSLSLNINVLYKELKKHLPYGDEQSALFIVDENDIIFSSCPEWIMEPDCQKSIRDSTDILKRNDTATEHNVYTFDGKVYCAYQLELNYLPWRIFSFSQTEAIYHETNLTIKVLISVSVIGMLLMLICCIVVFRQTRENLRSKASAEEELRMAAMVQTSLLKPVSCRISTNTSCITLNAFIRPAKEAGGDLYDYVQKEGKLIFCIGDVSGKGMPAALFMTQVVSLFRNAVRNTSEPSEIVSQINDVLSDNPERTFCTFFVGLLSGDELSFCNAGHNPPVLISSQCSFLKPRPNLAIGLKKGYHYHSETLPFSPGDRLVLYTDGVTESRDEDRHLFGEDKLLTLLASLSRDENPASITAHITESLEKFVCQAEQSDDITIVTLGTDRPVGYHSLPSVKASASST